jgi:hypothetical protein
VDFLALLFGTKYICRRPQKSFPGSKIFQFSRFLALMRLASGKICGSFVDLCRLCEFFKILLIL